MIAISATQHNWHTLRLLPKHPAACVDACSEPTRPSQTTTRTICFTEISTDMISDSQTTVLYNIRDLCGRPTMVSRRHIWSPTPPCRSFPQMHNVFCKWPNVFECVHKGAQKHIALRAAHACMRCAEAHVPAAAVTAQRAHVAPSFRRQNAV